MLNGLGNVRHRHGPYARCDQIGQKIRKSALSPCYLGLNRNFSTKELIKGRVEQSHHPQGLLMDRAKWKVKLIFSM